MVSEKEGMLRKHEQLLRRCTSVEAAIKLVPTLIHDPSSSLDRLEVIGSETGRTVYKLKSLEDSVFFIPSFLSETEVVELSSEIVRRMIDSPPHANSFPPSGTTVPMWTEYLDPTVEHKRLNKLRWSCVGYHYNWGERTYDPDKMSDFPHSFTRHYNNVLEMVNRACGQSKSVLTGDPQSAIINFYHSHRISDRLGGHRDDVESTDDTPLVSISMGIPGVFLIENECILLRSGDALVMADRARQSLHGVPCIIGEKRDGGRATDSPTDNRPQNVLEFIKKTRMSISIRQVY